MKSIEKIIVNGNYKRKTFFQEITSISTYQLAIAILFGTSNPKKIDFNYVWYMSDKSTINTFDWNKLELENINVLSKKFNNLTELELRDILEKVDHIIIEESTKKTIAQSGLILYRYVIYD